MKKLFVALISAVLCFSLFAFVGCDHKSTENDDINIEDCEVGYKVNVYPNCEFDYQYDANGIQYQFHISSISAELTKKNTISSGDVIQGEFYPYEFTLTATGRTDSALAGKSFYLMLMSGNSGRTIICTIDPDGNFDGTKTYGTSDHEMPRFFFWAITSLD